MELKELITLHNKRLEQQTEEKPFLNQRIKARLKEPRHKPFAALTGKLLRSALLYGFIFVALILAHTWWLNGLKKTPHAQEQTQKPQLLAVNMDAFSPNFPGSIDVARVFQEVKP